jgi:hypothetical protein
MGQAQAQGVALVQLGQAGDAALGPYRDGGLAGDDGEFGLDDVLSNDPDAVRTGRLAASLRVSARGAASGDGIFDLGDDFVRVGSSVPYARQLQFPKPILPKKGKALAIPLTTKLKRQQVSPRDIDPQRQVLSFIPSDDGRGIGVLIDEKNQLGFGTAPLFALVARVTQEPRPFLFWSEDDQNTIATEIYPQWLRGE